MHPGAWMAWTACAALVAFSSTNPFYLLLVMAVCWFVYSANRRPGPAGRTFRFFLITAAAAIFFRTALVAISWDLTASNLAFAAMEGLRLGTLLVVFGTFNSVTDPYGVLRLAPRHFHEPALAAALALSMAPRTIDAAGRVLEAQTMRGIRASKWRSIPSLAVPVLETGMDEAVTLAESMDSRGHGRGARSRYRPQPWTNRARLSAAAAALAAAAFIAAGIERYGMLNPPTDPLVWPQVSLPLAATILLLAMPAFLPQGEDGP